jgi:hypothetical protein
MARAAHARAQARGSARTSPMSRSRCIRDAGSVCSCSVLVEMWKRFSALRMRADNTARVPRKGSGTRLSGTSHHFDSTPHATCTLLVAGGRACVSQHRCSWQEAQAVQTNTDLRALPPSDGANRIHISSRRTSACDACLHRRLLPSACPFCRCRLCSCTAPLISAVPAFDVKSG